MEHAIGYAVVVGAVLLGIPTWVAGALGIPVSLIGGRFAGFRPPVLLPLLVAWLTIAFLWERFLGYPIPIALLVVAFLWAGWTAKDPKLTDMGHHMAGAEQWAIFLTGIGVAVMSDSIRWY